ncbi:MAG: hypothetical protein ABIP20_20995 [Chthoniobacteraceae bacterium]
MKKPLLILLAAVAVATYFGCYRLATRDTRRMLGDADSVAWLRKEFRLTDEQARAVARLQAEYEPRCMEMCERISKSGECMATLLQNSATMTPELETAVREASNTEADCHVATLKQAFAISAHMAPEQAARYRTMVVGRSLPKPARHDMRNHR